GNRAWHAAGERRHHCHFPIQHMRPCLADHFLSMLGMQPNGDLVPHRPGRHKNRSLTPKDCSRPLLQFVDGRVLTIHIIANFRRRHRRPHRRRRLRHCVTAQINHVHSRFLCFFCRSYTCTCCFSCLSFPKGICFCYCLFFLCARWL